MHHRISTGCQAGTIRTWFHQAAFAAALLVAALSIGWGRAAHVIMLRESAAAMPMPLSKWLNDHLPLALATVNKPDEDVGALLREARELDARARQSGASQALKAESEEAWKRYHAERTGHFFDIDVLTDQSPPFHNFPRPQTQAARYAAAYLHQQNRTQAAELLELPSADDLPAELDDATALKLGRAALLKFGTLPWQISTRLARVEEAFKQGDLDSLPAALGELAHFVADLHQPLHVTYNFDGKFTGNAGIHRYFETYIVNRYLDHYEVAAHQAVARYRYVDDPLEAVFAVVDHNYERLTVILQADTAARRESGLTEQDIAYLKSLPHAEADALMLRTDMADLADHQRRIVRHAELLHDNLLTAGDVASQQIGRAATLFASLIYTAWVNADRPSLKPADHAAASTSRGQPETTQEYIRVFLVIGAMLLLLMAFGSRLKRRPPPAGK